MAATCFVWLCSWLVLSGFVTRVVDKAHYGVLDLTANLGFTVENILVEGRHYADPHTIKAITNVQRGDPLFSFDPFVAQDLIQKLAWVKGAHVERRMPDTIYIRIEERVPLALWQRGDNVFLIDEDGIVVTDRNLGQFRDLAVLTGQDAPKEAANLFALLQAEPQIHSRVEGASFIAGRRWNLALKSGVLLKLPGEGFALALRRLVRAHEEEGLLDTQNSIIDMRELDRITVRTKPGESLEYKAVFQPSSGSKEGI